MGKSSSAEGFGAWPQPGKKDAPTSLDRELSVEQIGKAKELLLKEQMMMLREHFPDASYDEAAEEVSFTFRDHQVVVPWKIRKDGKGEVFSVPEIAFSPKVNIKIDGAEVNLADKIRQFIEEDNEGWKFQHMSFSLANTLTEVVGLINHELRHGGLKVQPISKEHGDVDVDTVLAEMYKKHENKDDEVSKYKSRFQATDW